jgi:hypothetical protein
MKKTTVKTLTLALASACLASTLLLVAGCGPKTPKITAEQSKSFESAPPEVKQVWEKALAADKANDYVAAAAALDSLKTMILSDQQRNALDVEREAFGLRLMKEVDKNNPAALQALQNSQKSQNDSRRR